MYDYPEYLSFGGGINSTALAIVAIKDGWRGKIIFSDTGAEWPDTYCHIDYFEKKYLNKFGLNVIKLGPRHAASRDKRIRENSLIEYCERYKIIPLASVRWCTLGWKVEPIQQYIGNQDSMIGIAAEEAHRVKGRIAPLVDMSIDRMGCIKIIKDENLTVPPKSGCWMCPFQSDPQWKLLWQKHPRLFYRALDLEESAIENAKKLGRKVPHAVLDPSGKITLRERLYHYEHQIMLPDMEDLTLWQPCMCTL